MAFVVPAVSFLFTSQSLTASAARFVAASLISSALNRTSSEGPRLNDLAVQRSEYGANIPLLYGDNRGAGNLIHASDYIEAIKKKKKKKLGIVTISKNTTFSYSVNFGMLLAAGELPSTVTVGRIWANGTIIFDSTTANAEATAGSNINSSSSPSNVVGVRWTRADNTHSFMEEVRFYRGAFDQDPDAALEAVDGVGNVPSYHGTAYVVIEGLQVTDEFGNQLPGLELELIDSADVTAESIVADIGNRVGVTIYSGPLRSTISKGYAVANAGHAWSALEPLSGIYSFDIIADRTVLEVVKRGTGITAHIPNEDLAGRPSGPGVKSTKDLSREDVLGLPKEVVLTFNDASRDYQSNSVRAFRDQGESNNKVTVEVPLVIDVNEAQQAVDRMLWEANAATRKVKMSVTRKWERALRSTDVVTLDIGAERRAFLLTRVQKGRNGVVNLEAVFEDPLVYQSTNIGTSGSFSSGTVKLPGQTTLHPMDAAIVDNLDNNSGMYWGVSAPGDGWRGAVIERSIDGGLSFDEVADTILTSIVGNVLGTLPDARTDIFDEGSELIVTLIRADDELATVTELDIFNGDNIAWIGSADGTFGEWIQFRDANAVGSPMTYNLTGLLRGRFGTEYATALHTEGEVFILFEGDAVGRSEFPASEWNKTRKWRAVSSFTDAADAVVLDITNTGEGKRPLSGVNLQGHRDQGDDSIRICWTRRSRLTSPTLGGGLTPLGEETESYEVDIFDNVSSPATIVRTEVVSTPEFIYTEAMQTADGHTLGDPAKVSIYQMSTIRGRGRPLEGIV